MRESRKLIQNIGNSNPDIRRVELIVQYVERFGGNVPAVLYDVFNNRNREIAMGTFVCRGYWRSGKMEARKVANGVREYYRLRGVETKVRDLL